MTLDQEEFPPSQTEEDRAKKPYVTPELIIHGAVEKLTEKIGPGQQDESIWRQNRS